MSTFMDQYYVMEAQVDVTNCSIITIVILHVQPSLQEGGLTRANMGVLPLPILALP